MIFATRVAIMNILLTSKMYLVRKPIGLKSKYEVGIPMKCGLTLLKINPKITLCCRNKKNIIKDTLLSVLQF